MQPTRPLPEPLPQSRIIPIVENRALFEQVFHASDVQSVLLRHCNPLEFIGLLEQAHRRALQVYVNVDNIDGVSPDTAGLRYLAQRLHITGIVSNNPRTLALGKDFGLKTVQRIFAMDSAGLEAALESMDTRCVDLLDISPALVIPYIASYLKTSLPLPFMGSGLLQTAQQVEAVLKAGALSVTVTRADLWR